MGNKGPRYHEADMPTKLSADIYIGSSEYNTTTTSDGAPMLHAQPTRGLGGYVTFNGNDADAVESFRTAVDDWADQYTAWDNDGEPER